MNEEFVNSRVKIAIVGMTGSGKTVLISTLATKIAQSAVDGVFMKPCGKNRRETLRFTESNWQTLNEGSWPASTPAGELIKLQWNLTTRNQQARVQFLDCAGQDIRTLFRTDDFQPDSLEGDLKKVYKSVNSANILILLINMKDLLATSNYVEEIMDLDQMFHTLKSRKDIPRKIVVVFSQYDKYKPEVDQQYNGDFMAYLRHYLPYLHGQYVNEKNFDIIPVAAVNDTQTIVEDEIVKQNPAPNFSSYNLEQLIQWIAESVEELAPQIAEKADSFSVDDDDESDNNDNKVTSAAYSSSSARKPQKAKRAFGILAAIAVVFMIIIAVASSISPTSKDDRDSYEPSVYIPLDNDPSWDGGSPSPAPDNSTLTVTNSNVTAWKQQLKTDIASLLYPYASPNYIGAKLDIKYVNSTPVYTVFIYYSYDGKSWFALNFGQPNMYNIVYPYHRPTPNDVRIALGLNTTNITLIN